MTLPDPDLARLVERAARAIAQGTDGRSLVELGKYIRQNPSKEAEVEKLWGELLRNRPKVE